MATEVLSRKESQRERDRATVERAAEEAAALATPGYLFTHAWLQEQLGIGLAPADGDARDRWHMRKLTLVEMWRCELGKHWHVHTDSSHGKGYVVVPPGESTPLLTRQTFSAVGKALQQGRERMEHWIDPNTLTPQQRQERIDAMGRITLLEHALKQARPRPPKMPIAPVTLLAAPRSE